MNVAAHQPNEPLCVPAARRPASFSFLQWQFAHICRSILHVILLLPMFRQHSERETIHTAVLRNYRLTHTHKLMRCSISCCMKLKMACGRGSTVYLLRGHGAVFLYHLKGKEKKKNTAMQLPAQLTKRR